MKTSGTNLSAAGIVLTFLKKGTCSQTSCTVLNRAFGYPMADEELAAMRLAGGLMRYGYQCGLIWGATLAAGAEAHRRRGAGPEAEALAVLAGQRLVRAFRARNHEHMNCLEITELDRSASTRQMFTYFLLKGGTLGCFRRAAVFARPAYDEIHAILSDEHFDLPSRPMNCAAILARRMGASDLHATMVAGFAGGIGLSGGACGALGAAIWLNGLNQLRVEGGRKLVFDDSQTTAVIDRFLEYTGHEFECSSIAARRFERPGDLAAYLNDGGCSKILDGLCDRQPAG